MMEKRRRARINASLEQLKKLVLDATRRDVSTARDRFQASKILFNHFNEPRWEDIVAVVNRIISVRYTCSYSEI